MDGDGAAGCASGSPSPGAAWTTASTPAGSGVGSITDGFHDTYAFAAAGKRNILQQ